MNKEWKDKKKLNKAKLYNLSIIFKSFKFEVKC